MNKVKYINILKVSFTLNQLFKTNKILTIVHGLANSPSFFV